MNTDLYRPRRTAARWAVMPNVTSRARRFAQLAVGPSADALRQLSAELIVIHFQGINGQRRKIAASVWCPDGDGFRIFDGQNLHQAVLSEIAGALGETVRELAARWPANARPRTIGLALDGNAIVFNATYPGAEGHKWLEEHLAGRAPAAMLHNDGGEGLLTRLCQYQR